MCEGTQSAPQATGPNPRLSYNRSVIPLPQEIAQAWRGLESAVDDVAAKAAMQLLFATRRKWAAVSQSVSQSCFTSVERRIPASDERTSFKV